MTRLEREEKVRQARQEMKETLEKIISSEKEFKKFLDTASYMTKYEFEDQLMIHGRRRDATACGTFDMWRKIFGKVVVAKTEGIPIIRKNKYGTESLTYVFDINDTVDIQGKTQEEQAELENLQANYKLWKYEDDKDILDNVADKLNANTKNLERQEAIRGIINSLLEKENTKIKKAIKINKNGSYYDISEFIRNTVEYLVSKRLDIKIDVDFENIADINSLADINKVLDISNKLSRIILNEIQLEKNKKTLAKKVNSSYILSNKKNTVEMANNAPQGHINQGGNEDERNNNIRRNRKIILQRWRNTREHGNRRKVYSKIWIIAPSLSERGRYTRNSTGFERNNRQWTERRTEDIGTYNSNNISGLEVTLPTDDRYRPIYRDRIDGQRSFGLEENSRDDKRLSKDSNSTNDGKIGSNYANEIRRRTEIQSGNELYTNGDRGRNNQEHNREKSRINDEEVAYPTTSFLDEKQEEKETVKDLIHDEIKNKQIKNICIVLGVDEIKLKNIMSLHLKENNLNEFGSFDDLKQTIDKKQAKEYFEKIEGKEIIPPKVMMKADKLLREFVLSGGFDIEIEKGEKIDEEKNDILQKPEIILNVGYDYIILNKNDIPKDINIRINSKIKGIDLYVGTTFEDSRKLDVLFDSGQYEVYKITELNKYLLDTEETQEKIYDKLNSANVENTKPIQSAKNFKLSEETLPEKLLPSERLKNNIEAIKVLKILEKESRDAVPEEQEILAKYVGFGGISDVFDETKTGQWQTAREFLKENLTKEEYENARASTLTAFYTPKTVIDSIYNTLENNGFAGGRILEPSCGVGNFIGLLPESMSKSKVYGVELDSLSARITSKLYPEANIQNMGFEKTNFTDNIFDVVIGNVPFGEYKLYDKTYDKNNFLIHDFFFAKSIDKVKPGGVIAFITSSGTLDKKDDSVRKYIGERCEFLGAIRLPQDTFKGVAGTEVTSDIIFLQKRDTIRRDIDKDNDFFTSISEDKNGLSYNKYFVDNPDMILGNMKKVSGRFGEKTVCVNDTNEDLQALLDKSIKNIKIDFSKIKEISKTKDNNALDDLPQSEYKNFSYHIIDGKLMYKDDKSIEIAKLTKKDEFKVKELIAIRESVRDILDSQLLGISDYELKQKQDLLNKEYDAFIEKFGYLKDYKGKFKDDASYPLIISLEKVVDKKDDQGNIVYDENGEKLTEAQKSDIFSKRTLSTPKPIEHTDSSIEALTLSLFEKGKIDFNYMENLTGKDSEMLKKELKGEIFYCLQSEEYKTKDEYLSGDVRKKLHYLKNKIEEIQFQKNIDIKRDYVKNINPKISIDLQEILMNFGTDKLNQKDRELIQNYVNDNANRYAEEFYRKYVVKFLNGEKKYISDRFNSSNIDYLGYTLRTEEDLKTFVVSKFAEYLKLYDENKNTEFNFSMTKDDYYKFKQEYKDFVNDRQSITEVEERVNYNILQLNKVLPKDIEATDISVKIGTTWIPTKYYDEFMYETFNTSKYKDIKVEYSPYTATYRIENKSKDKFNDTANLKFATKRVNVYELMEATLNARDIKVNDTITENGKKSNILNHQETTLAMEKQEYLNTVFQDWIFKDKTRRDELTKIYNKNFNSVVNRVYDGKNMKFPNMNTQIKLKSHQKDAIMHAVFGGNTLFAHCVGAGKTFEMIATAIESKRLGLCNKSLFVVPNHITQQTANEFLTLYPNSNILIAEEKDFKKENRKIFTSKIATGNYDAIIIGQTQFEKIPMSEEYQKEYIENQIEEITDAIEELRETENSNSFSVKQLEGMKKKLEVSYEKMLNAKEKDDVLTFEQLGIDKLFVDEAHDYKNLEFVTKMGNIAGINPQGSQRASDLFMKCRYMDSITDGKGIVFATGTPISNSLAELYTMQKYLQYDDLLEKGHHLFDAWASQYAYKETKLELAPEGNGFRQKTRFSKYVNLPELMTGFRKIADIKTKDMLDLPVPKAYHETIVIKPTDIQKELMQSLLERAERVRNKQVDKDEDNMLAITNDGKRLALDQRLLNDMLPKDENSKYNICANKVYEIYKKTEDKKSTQVIFCDTSTPTNKQNKSFNIYDDIKDALIQKGVKPDEIAFIHDAKTKNDKQELFEKVSSGNIRVIIGSTAKMGTGTNMQDKLIALHDLDAPYRPSDLEQRSGRIIRQGNENKEVYIYRYVTENSFDAYLYQLLENKQRITSQIMTDKTLERTVEEDDEIALSYAEIKALATGNPLIKEKIELDADISKIKLLKAEYTKNIYDLQDKIETKYPIEIYEIQEKISKVQSDLLVLNENNYIQNTNVENEFSGILIKGNKYQDKKEAGEVLLKEVQSLNTFEYGKKIGEYKGFDISVKFDTLEKMYIMTLKNNYNYDLKLGSDIFGNLTRIDNKIKDIPDLLDRLNTKLEEKNIQLNQAKQDVVRPFFKENILNEKIERLKFVEKELTKDMPEVNSELKKENTKNGERTTI